MPDDRAQSPTDGLRLTYTAIASRLGISGDAARQLVRRRGWRRIIPNRQGAPATIIVPEDELAAEQWRQGHSDRATSPDEGASPNVLPTSPDTAQLEAENTRLTTLLRAAEERADRAEQRADAADADRRQADIRAEAAEADRRQADRDRRAAESRANQVEQRAESERERANRAEQGRDGERDRADALRDRLDALQTQLAEAEAEGAASDVEMAELTAQLREARLHAEGVLHAAEIRHEAEATARRSLGRLARLRAAWRGG